MKILANLNVAGTLDIDTLNNAAADTDKFLVADANGIVKFRTGAEVASDIGASVGYVSTVKHEVKLGEDIAKGQAVYVTSSDGTNMIVSKASNGSDATSSKTFGLLETGGAANAKVFVITEGLLAGLDTSTAAAGDPVWLGTAGNLLFGLASKPVAPAHMVFIGIVTRSNINNGEIFVKVQNGFELEELHNVLITGTPVDKAVIQYDTATGLWKNSTQSGIIGSGAAGQVAYFTGATTQAGSNNLFWDSANNRLGIGTNAPAFPLHVVGGTYLNGTLSVGTTTSNTGYITNFATIPVLALQNSTSGSGATDGFQLSLSGSLAYIWQYENAAMLFGTNGSERARIFATGNFGIGTGASDSGQRLQVIGTGYFSDSVGIGNSGSVASSLRISKALATGNTIGIYMDSQIQSTLSNVSYFQSEASTSASAITITHLRHYFATAPSFGAGSTVTNQYGFAVQGSTLINATNNYGFWGDIAAGTNRWNLYMGGTANNYMAGSLGIGTTGLTGVNLFVSKNLTGAVGTYSIIGAGTIQSDVTTQAYYFLSQASTQNATFTLPDLAHFVADQGTFGASSTVTRQYGVRVRANLIGATNNYAFYGEIPSGTGRWNLYMNGSALNYLNGSLLIGSTTDSGEKLQVTGTMKVTGTATFNNNIAITSGVPYIQLTDTTTNNVSFLEADDTGLSFSADNTNAVASSIIRFRIDNTERMRLDASGNLGLGVTPSAWWSSARVLELPNGVSLWANTGVSSMSLTANAFVNSSVSWIYKISAQATRYDQYQGQHQWYNAPSGTAGNAITFTQAMTLDASGNLGIGTTTTTNRLNVTRSGSGVVATFDSDANASITIRRTGTSAGTTTLQQADSGELYMSSTTRMYFNTNSSNNLLINNNGNVLIQTGGTFSDSGEKLQVTGTAKITDSATFTKAYSNTSDLGVIVSATIPGINLRTVSTGRTSFIQSYNSNGTSSILVGTGSNNPTTTVMTFNGNDGTVNVGSWVASTGELLQVQGTAKITGALSGLSATFTSDITTNSSLYISNSTGLAISINSSTNNPYIRFMQTGVTKFYIGERTAISGDGGTGYDFYTVAGNDMRFFAGATKALTLSTSGAATFSSSIQAGGGTTNASAVLQADSTTKGFLPPRMTAAQRTAISTPAEGLIVVQTDGVLGLYIYINSTWRTLTMV
jgi:hypothetical protein